jgi:uracil-DNA glycosylase
MSSDIADKGPIINISWKPFFKEHKKEIRKILSELEGIEYLPPKNDIFNVFRHPFNEIKVVILGQDCYHGKGQANGYAFSVNKGVKLPPSLVNIFKEVDANGYGKKDNGAILKDWAAQGVFLLNCALTVPPASPGAHMKIWEKFTDSVIKYISKELPFVVFMLWGNFAHKKENLIDGEKHLVLKCGHPSPLSVKLFFGNNHFKLANEALQKRNIEPIKW